MKYRKYNAEEKTAGGKGADGTGSVVDAWHTNAKRCGFIGACAIIGLAIGVQAQNTPGSNGPGTRLRPIAAEKPFVAVFYFPDYHVDPRNEKIHGKGWTEWELMKVARPRFPGHQQPKIPAWGYEDEADPKVMRKKIDVAASHGIDAFIFDWYWMDDRPLLNRALDEAFLQEDRDGKLKFALMWANHGWGGGMPTVLGRREKELYSGKITPEIWENATNYMAEHYFKHPACWKIDGRIVFSMYDLQALINNLGGIEATRAAFDRLDEKARAAGAKGIYLNLAYWSNPILPGEKKPCGPEKLIPALGARSVTAYCWSHVVYMTSFPMFPYLEMMEGATKCWRDRASKFSVPYWPNVSMGWDPSPRAAQSDIYQKGDYPFSPVLVDNTPENFKKALQLSRSYLMERPVGERVVTINAWNEWTEGSYLEPDTVNGMKYLEAIRDVYGN